MERTGEQVLDDDESGSDGVEEVIKSREDGKQRRPIGVKRRKTIAKIKKEQRLQHEVRGMK